MTTPILCNLCGLPGNDLEDGTPNFGLFHGVEIDVLGGYASTPGNGDGALDDGTSYGFRLCEFCLDFLFACAVVPPTVVALGDGPEPFVPAAIRVRNDAWRNHRIDEWKARYQARANARRVGFVEPVR